MLLKEKTIPSAVGIEELFRRRELSFLDSFFLNFKVSGVPSANNSADRPKDFQPLEFSILFAATLLAICSIVIILEFKTEPKLD